MASKPAILITGASGYVGKHLVHTLANRGHQVVAMYYHRLPTATQNVFPVCSDMSSPELLAAPLRGVEVVYHLAWDGTFGEKTEENKNKNITILKNLIAAMERAKTRRIVFVSALGASRKATNEFLKEKYLSEFLILNSKIPEKVILRPAVICGKDSEGDKFLRSIKRVMRYPAFYPIPEAKKQIAPVAVQDVARTLADIAFYKLEEAASIIEIEGGESFEIQDLFKYINRSVMKGSQIPLQGFVGETLLPLFERDGERTATIPRLRNFLVLAAPKNDHHMRFDSALSMLVPQKRKSFKDLIEDEPVALPPKVN
jgi:uncharacterized protein YbjT (DUF2867 family)